VSRSPNVAVIVITALDARRSSRAAGLRTLISNAVLPA
jgi:hypothetical protein